MTYNQWVKAARKYFPNFRFSRIAFDVLKRGGYEFCCDPRIDNFVMLGGRNTVLTDQPKNKTWLSIIGVLNTQDIHTTIVRDNRDFFGGAFGDRPIFEIVQLPHNEYEYADSVLDDFLSYLKYEKKVLRQLGFTNAKAFFKQAQSILEI